MEVHPDGQPRNPDRLVLDLDPGPGVTLPECAEIAVLVRDILRDIGHDPVPVTSGSKGIHLYAPLDGSLSTEQASELARELAVALESEHRDRVISSMKRSSVTARSSSTGARTTAPRRRSRRIRCGAENDQRSRRLAPGGARFS